MFSESYSSEIKQYFDRQMALLYDRGEALKKREEQLSDTDKNLYRFSRRLLEQKIEEIQGALAGCTQDETEALRFLYSAMPLSDVLDYPAELYQSYAKHAVFLWREGPFAGKVPEKIFANYVLHYRVHNEDIADTRPFFYGELRERIAGKSMYDAVIAANYWCAEKATYQATFMRTQNPLTMYGTAIGRCGEGGPFATTALRSIGIPAREAAAPFWAHCDDNHAWVEAWCDGEWHFLGGGEPESRLDKSWFVAPASRAMLIDSAWFGKDKPEEPVAARRGMATILNHLPKYADTLELTVHVTDEKGKPVPGARVDFNVLNYARFGSLTSLYTGEKNGEEDYGAVRLDTGYGDLLLCAYADGCYGEKHISLTGCGTKNERLKKEDDAADEDRAAAEGSSVTGKRAAEECLSVRNGTARCTIVIRRDWQKPEQWRELDFRAPKEVPCSEGKTEEEPAGEKLDLEAAAKKRQQRAAEFYEEEDAERVLARFSRADRDALDDILHEARGNMGEIVRFLEWDFGGQTEELCRLYGEESWKLKALQTLKKNDYWDIKAEVLAECCVCSSPYAERVPEDVFFDCLLCPGVMFEMPRTGRKVLLNALGEEQKAKIRRDPKALISMIEGLVIAMPEQEYANLVTSPVGCLTGGVGSRISKNVLCVQIYRTLGIPARMRPMDRALEYYMDEQFVPVVLEAAGGRGKIVLRAEGEMKLNDWKHYSLAKFEDGRFQPVFIRPRKKGEKHGETPADSGEEVLSGEFLEDIEREFQLEQGIYRVVTTNRLQNGSQLVRVCDFCLGEGEVKRLTLSMREITMEAMLDETPVEELTLQTAEGEGMPLSALTGDGRALLLWLELGKEPTEHILNELCEKAGMFSQLSKPIFFVVRKGADWKGDPTLTKARAAVPQAKFLFDDFGTSYEKFSYQVGRNPWKLPLAVILEGGRTCIYSDAGYNVGMSETLLRILL